MLGISRPTIRQALGELTARGCLRRVKGKGTFVADPDGGRAREKAFVHLEDPEGAGGRRGLRTRVLDFRRATASLVLEEELMRAGFLPGGDLFLLRRLQLAGDDPAALLETYLPEERCGGLRGADLARLPLRAALETACGVRVSRTSHGIEAVCATPREAETLCVAPFAPLLLVRSVGRMDDGEPLEITLARYRGDRVRLGSGGL